MDERRCHGFTGGFLLPRAVVVGRIGCPVTDAAVSVAGDEMEQRVCPGALEPGRETGSR